jgi:SOS-response transcriptional repressor LexA
MAKGSRNTDVSRVRKTKRVIKREMSPAQKETFLIIDEYWKNFGYGPTIDDIMRITGEKGRGNVSRKMKTLIEIGVCKGIPGRSRSIRPAYISLRNLN